MTRVLVCGPAVFDDPLFVHHSLNEVNSIYGPISCVIHNNHLSAMLWQQWVARRQETRHCPIVLDMRDGVAKHDRCRDRMFRIGRPEMVIVFEIEDKREPGRDELSQLIIHRALDRGLPLATYAYCGRAERDKKAVERAANIADSLARVDELNAAGAEA